MKLGVRCNPLKIKNDLPGLFAWLAENGYDSADLMSPDADTLGLMTAAGLVPGSFDLPGVPALLSKDEAKREQAAVDVNAGIAKAADLGLTTLFVCLVPEDRNQSRADSFEIWKHVFPGIVERAESAGVNIAMEAWPGPGPSYPTLGVTPETLRAMFGAVPSPALGICYDPSHLVRLGIDYVRVLKEFGDRVHHVHGKDCDIMEEELYLQGRLSKSFGGPAFACSEGWWRYCVPGDGLVDWRTVVVGLIAAGYDGVISVELEDGIYMGDEDANRRGLVAARDALLSVIR